MAERKLWQDEGPSGDDLRRINLGINRTMAETLTSPPYTPKFEPASPSAPSEEVILRTLVDGVFPIEVAKQIRAGIKALPPDKREALLRKAVAGEAIQDLLTVAQGGFSKEEQARIVSSWR